MAVAPRQARAKVETWREEGRTAFAKTHREGVVVTDSGRVRLGRAVSAVGALSAARVWDLARTREGVVFAATGDAGQVFRREPKADSGWTVALDSTESQVLALASLPDGTVFAGTGPGGQVINLSDPAHPLSRPDAKVQYIWDLASDAEGNLFAATGPTGQLWKRSREGRWSLVYDSKATHLLCVAVGPDGAVYAGSDGAGLIYRVSPGGKVTVLFDAPATEVRTLLAHSDGSVFAGTATESGGPSGSRGTLFSAREAGLSRRYAAVPGRGGSEPSVHAARVIRTAQAATSTLAQAQARPSRGGTAAPRAVSPGENAVYRLDRDGVPREVLRVKALVFALAWAGDHLVVGTGPEGQLYEVWDAGDDTAPSARLDHGQILSLLAEPGGGVLIGTGDPGSVLRHSSDFVRSGRLVSEVHDTKLLSRFGALSWRADQPAGTSLSVSTRSGNVGEPDETWSPWSEEQTEPASAKVDSPAGRFVQYRLTMATSDPRRTPELRSIALSFRTSNLAPEITRLDVPDVSAADGAARQTRLNLRWESVDPNDDDLNFVVLVRKDGWPDWVRLTEDPISDRSYTWDTTAFPSGSYRVKVLVGDRPSNRPQEALSCERESLAFLVDHDPPRVRLEAKGRAAVIRLDDGLTRIAKADYAIDGGPWTPIFPDDGLFDSPRELVTVSLADLKRGTHLIMVRATDAAGNVGTGDALVQIPNHPGP
jgi:hypothetical protein